MKSDITYFDGKIRKPTILRSIRTEFRATKVETNESGICRSLLSKVHIKFTRYASVQYFWSS